MRFIYTILLLFASNIFMTVAWYGHLKFKNWGANAESVSGGSWTNLLKIIIISWGIAFFEYVLMVPANRLGSKEYGGNLDLTQLKVIQEAISLVVFVVMVVFFFKGETLKWSKNCKKRGCFIWGLHFLKRSRR
jgi:uncharacterized protein (DUF486 family)